MLALMLDLSQNLNNLTRKFDSFQKEVGESLSNMNSRLVLLENRE